MRAAAFATAVGPSTPPLSRSLAVLAVVAAVLAPPGSTTVRGEADLPAAVAIERALAERRVELARRVLEAERAEASAAAAAEAAQAIAVAAHATAAARAEALRPLWPVARRLALWPAETLLAAPVPPADALRGLDLLQAIWRRLSEAAATARQAAAEASGRAAQAATRAVALAEAEATARAAVAQLDRELEAARGRRAAVQDAEAQAASRAAQAAARARNLEAAIERVSRPPPQPVATAPALVLPAPPSPPPPAGRHAVVVPVSGRVQHGFGENQGGTRAQGISFAAPAGARVVAPCAGRAVFAGPFRSYGRMVIVACGGNVHVVLAGLARLDAEAGDRLLAGEPVGVLPGKPGTAGGGPGGTLYVELRRGGEAVDPQPWLATGR